MTQINDAILAATGGPTVADGLLAFYQAGGATAAALADAERQWLRIQMPAAEGSNSDLWVQYLIGLGYAGSLDDMKLRFWSVQ